MAFIAYPKGTRLSDGTVADGVTQYNDEIVKPVGSVSVPATVSAPASTAPKTTGSSSSGSYSFDVGRSQPYVIDKNLVDALKYGIKTGILTAQQAASSLINGAVGANADAFRVVNPVSQVIALLASGIGEVTQGGRVGTITEQGNFVPTQTTIRQSTTTGQGTSVGITNEGSQYVRVQGAYFKNTPDGLIAVNDPETLRKLNNNQIKAPTYNSLFDVPSAISDPIKKSAEDYAKAVYESGYTLNPNIDSSSFDLLSYQDMMGQAESIVKPYFQERLKTTKADLQLYADRIGVDLGKSEASIKQKSEDTRTAGRETLAGRGLAFSGASPKFESRLTEDTTKAINDARDLAFRNAQDLLFKAEGQVGSANVGPISFSSPEYSASISPRGGVTGSDVYESNANTRDLARALASDENLRRQEAYNSYIRSLSFA